MKEDERLYRIGAFAEKAGLSIRTVRYYDLEGLLVPRHRSLAGFRLYEKQDYDRLRRILALKFLDLPLHEIRQILNTQKGDLREVLARQRGMVSRKIEELRRTESAIVEAEKCVGESTPINWDSIFGVVDAMRKEPKMSTFSLNEEQFNSASLGVLYRHGKKPLLLRSRILRPIIWTIIVAVLIAIPLIFKQYIGAGILVLVAAFVCGPLIWKSRKYKGNVQARTKRLTSIPYKVQVSDSILEVEYERSSFRMPFENLLVNKSNPDFYAVFHELGLHVYIPVSSLSTSERDILDRHTSRGSFDWSAKVAQAPSVEQGSTPF